MNHGQSIFTQYAALKTLESYVAPVTAFVKSMVRASMTPLSLPHLSGDDLPLRPPPQPDLALLVPAHVSQRILLEQLRRRTTPDTDDRPSEW